MPVDPISLGLSALQTGVGLFQEITGDSTTERLQKQRTSYKTPDEVFKMANAVFSNAGGDTIARDYKENKLDQSFSDLLGSATRLGADPNSLSYAFDKKVQGSIQIGEDFHDSNMKSFDKVLNAYNTIAENKVAEWRSKEDILKDEIQAAGARSKAGAANVGAGLSNAISTLSAGKISDLYKQVLGGNPATSPDSGSGTLPYMNQGMSHTVNYTPSNVTSPYANLLNDPSALLNLLSDDKITALRNKLKYRPL